MKTTTSRSLLALFVLAALALACATPSYRLARIDVGMTQDQVQEVMGPPHAVRLGGIRRGGGQSGDKSVEIWEYHLYDRAADRGISAWLGIGNPNTDYWLYFEDGFLYRWTRAGEKPALPVR